MICRQCLRIASRQSSRLTSAPAFASKRFSSTGPTSSSATPISNSIAQTSTPRSASGAPAATSIPGVAQPLSSPLSPAPHNTDAEVKRRPKKRAKVATLSSVSAGTVLKGLNFIKGGSDPVALEDAAYPDWLWKVLEKKDKGDAAGAGDFFAKSKKQRRLAAKRVRKEALLNPEKFAPKVPIYEQSIDLPGGDGSATGAIEAEAARESLNRAMREQRRAKIKEANFLKAMG